MIIDTHAHLMFEQFNGELEQVLVRAKGANILKIINVGCCLDSSKRSLEMALGHNELYATLGVHPYDAKDVNDQLLVEWKKLALENEKIVAIGECGLDYFKAKVSEIVQKRAFRMQLELARAASLPVIVHNREADEDTLELLREFNGADGRKRVEAVFHCYGSDLKFAKRLWEEGYLTSFTGILTYANTEKLKEVVEQVPLDKFMVETDSPYLAPQKYRGLRNEPAYVFEVVKEIAKLRGVSPEKIAEVSTKNALNFFSRLNH